MKGKMTMDIKKELRKVNDRINEIAKMIDKMIGAVEAPEKEKPKTAKIKSVKKPAVKPVAKKPLKLTVSDTVLGIIKKSKKGVNTAAIMEKTGLKAGHIYNTVSILKKQGKVKVLGKGLYVKDDFKED
jgi:predicted Rossmann fold nucleotide-binding protein DprA/Smf involved in DNA uptake